MEEDKDIKTTIPQIADIGKELFSDFLSELTRQRQLYVLFSSVTAVLLAFPYIKDVQGELGGIKFSFVDLVVAKHIAGWICIYFVLVYAASVIQDMQHHRYKIILSQFQLDLMLRTQDLSIKVEAIERMKNLFNQDGQVIETLQRLLQPKPKLKERLKNWLHNIKGGLLNVLISIFSARYRFGDEFLKEFEGTIQDRKFFENIDVNEIIDQLKEQKGHSQDELIKMIREREYKSLQEIKKRYDVFNRLRLFFEVFFPVGISCYAIWASLLK